MWQIKVPYWNYFTIFIEVFNFKKIVYTLKCEKYNFTEIVCIIIFL